MHPREDRGFTYKSAMSAASDAIRKRQMMNEVEEDEYDDPHNAPWVDKIKPRLAPDWLEFDRDRVD